MISAKRPLAITAAAVLAGLVAIVVAGLATGHDYARATLPAPLERAITSSQVERSFEVDPSDARKVRVDDTDVFLVSGGDGDACIGLEDGSAACGPAADLAAARLFLITVPASAEPGQSAIPASGSAHAVVYGYQPDDRAARATIRGTEGQILGSGNVVDGVYRVEITTDSHSRRMTEVRFAADDDETQAPPPVNLDER